MKYFHLFAQNAPIQIKPSDLNLQNAPTNVSDNQVATILGTVYLIAGIVAVIVIIVGGIRYASSNGDSAGVQAGKNTILYAVVGLIVIIMAAAITNFVIEGTTK
jgi:type IV secretory pathway VirB2 component (pilin)